MTEDIGSAEELKTFFKILLLLLIQQSMTQMKMSGVQGQLWSSALMFYAMCVILGLMHWF